MARYIFSLSLLLHISFFSLSQPKIDSLKITYLENLEQQADALVLFENLKNIGESYKSILQFDSALKYYQLQTSLVKNSVKNPDKRDSLLVESYLDITYLSSGVQKNKIGLVYTDSAIELGRKKNLHPQLIRALSNRGIFYTNQMELTKAINPLMEALGIVELIENEEERLSRKQAILINIGRNYLMLEDWGRALKYSKEAISISNSNDRYQAIANLNISAIYLNMEKPDSSLSHTLKANELFIRLNDTYSILNTEINLGSAYEKLENFENATVHYSKALKIGREVNAPGIIAQALGGLGNVYGKTREFSKSLNALHEALDLAELYDDKGFMKNFCETLSEVYARMGDFDKAYQYYTRFDVLNDSIRSQENRTTVNDLLIKYETAQKESEIANQKLAISTKEAAINTQQNQIYILLGSLIIILLAAIIFYNHFKAKQRQKLQNAIFEEKERGFESVLQATEEERTRISKELHDGIGQQLSALKLGLQNITKKMADKAQKVELENITSSFSKSAEEVRHISHQMMPRALMEKGLVEAIEDLLQSSFQYAQTDYTFEHHNVSERFNERIEVSVYRVVQELINNVIKHANANLVSVQLLKQKNNLLLFLEDNGKGMSNTATDGHGLLNIKSRLDMINGSVDYAPSPESGTSVTIKIPLN